MLRKKLRKFFKKFAKKMLTLVGHMCIIQHVSKRRAEETGCGSAWLERLVWDQEAAGSNPVTPIGKTKYAGVVQW